MKMLAMTIWSVALGYGLGRLSSRAWVKDRHPWFYSWGVYVAAVLLWTATWWAVGGWR